MKELNRNTAQVSKAFPERILQFGGGNFLRGFVDWIIDEYNTKTGSDLGILVIKPTAGGTYGEWRDQEGLFHVLTKGIREGSLVDESTLVTAVSRIIHPYNEFDLFLASAEQPDIRVIVSNTTESGLRVSTEDKFTDTPPSEFPAKLTQWMYRRYKVFNGNISAGCIVLPTELVENNGILLRDCILENARNWDLESEFLEWVVKVNTYCNTLVDRIIPGVGPQDEMATCERLGYTDAMVTQGEPYHLWAIEAPGHVREELPLDSIGLNVVYTDDLTPYRTQKVRILNGAHTLMVPVAILSGISTVKDTLDDPALGKFVRNVISDEIIPTLDMPEGQLRKFAADVLDRFGNPFIEHRLMSISLNSISKFKARVIPTLLRYVVINNTIPKRIALSFAALIRFYKGEWQGHRIELKDDPATVAFFVEQWKLCDGSKEGIQALVRNTLQWRDAWGSDLSEIDQLELQIANYLHGIEHGQLPEILNTLDA